MDKPTGSPAVGAKEKVEKQARQLAYDVRYKVKQAMSAKSGGGADPATVKKMYASQLAKSPAAPAVKARAKQMLLGEDLVDVKRLAVDTISSVMYDVFVEKKEEVVEEEIVEDTYLEQLKESEEKTYKVRVTDKKTGKSYVRMATRTKIAELRANSNISSVEMTGYGEATKSEKTKGKQTAAAKAGKDYDGDGEVESSSKEHAGVVHNAIQRKKGGKPDGQDTRKEDYNWQDGFAELIEKRKEETTAKKITGEGVDNSKLVTVFPDSNKGLKEAAEEAATQDRKKKQVAAQKKVLMAKLQQLQKGEPLVGEEVEVVDEKMDLAKADMGDVIKDFRGSKAPQFSGKSKEKRRDMAIAAVLTARRGGKKLGEECCPNCGGKGCSMCEKGEKDGDEREMPTKASLLKNKMRARGIKVAGETPSPRNMKTYDDIDEQMTTQTQFKPLPSSGSTGVNRPPAAPTLPPPSASKPKPKPQTKQYSGYSITGNTIQINSFEAEGETLEEGPAALAIRAGLAAGTAIAGTKIGQAAIDKVKGFVQKKKEAEAPYQKLLNQETEVEGEDLQEKPGDGYLGPTPIPNPIRLAKDAVDATNRASQKRVDAVNKVLPGSASMPKTTYFNKGPSAASQRYLGLKNSFEPQGEVVSEEESDRAKDKHLERGGMGARRDYDRPPAKKATNKELGIGEFSPEEKEKRRKQMIAHLKKMRK